KIRFKFDDLTLKPRLNVSAWPTTIAYRDDPDTEYPDNLMQFRMYTNYRALIDKAEVRIFAADQSLRDAPLAVVALNDDGTGEWQPNFPDYKAPNRELKYVLRVYDSNGRYDETQAQSIWIVDRLDTDLAAHDASKELLVGYGETRLAVEHIDKRGGTVTVRGSGVPSERYVWVAGRPVPVDK